MVGQSRIPSEEGFGAQKSNNRKKRYPTTPHTGTGTSRKMENALCDTVSQLRDFETAQKLL
jgi:hypothetical protein